MRFNFALSITFLLARAGAEIIGPHLLDGTNTPTLHRDIAQNQVSIEDLLAPFAGKKTGLAFASLSWWTRNARPGFLPANGASKSSIETVLCAISRWSVGASVPSRRWGPMISALARASKKVILRGSLLGGLLAMLWDDSQAVQLTSLRRAGSSPSPGHDNFQHRLHGRTADLTSAFVTLGSEN